MTNKEAIEMLKSKLDGNTDTSYEWAECVRLAVNALEGITAPPKSNADRIRQMTDEELFDFLDAITDTCGCWSPNCDNCPMKYKDTSPKCNIQAWLKQEVESNDR